MINKQILDNTAIDLWDEHNSKMSQTRQHIWGYELSIDRSSETDKSKQEGDSIRPVFIKWVQISE